jgi:hypothetical protein
LHGTYGINYAKLPVMYRRGTTLVRLTTVKRSDFLGVEDTPAEVGVASDTIGAAKFEMDSGVIHPIVRLVKSIAMVFPDYNRSTFLGDFLSVYD